MAIFASHQADLDRTRQLLSGYQGAKGGAGASKTAETGAAEKLHPLLIPINRIFILGKVPAAAQRALWLRLGFSAVATLLLVLLLRTPLLLAIIPVHSIIEWQRLRVRAYMRAEAFERDYTALLLSLASGVRTGLDPIVALTKAKDLFSERSEIGQELSQVQERLDHGASEESVITQFGLTIDHPDIRLFRSAFIMARREGSSLAECLQRLAKVTRQRQSFRRKVRGAVAMQKLSAFGIAACLVVIALVQIIGNPTAMIAAYNHPVGSKLLMTGAALVVIGLGWMMRMTRGRI